LDKENIAQLYFYKEDPQTEICDNFYRISDFDVLNSIKKLGKAGGKVNLDSKIEIGNKQNQILQNGSKRSPISKFARNLLWSFNSWWSKNLKKWLEDFKPDAIFFYGSNYVFSEKIVLKIAKKYSIPIITYWVDDFYVNSFSKSTSLLDCYNKKSYRNVTNKLMKKSEFVALNDYMEEKYSEVFHKKGNVIYTTSSIVPFLPKQKGEDKIVMSFLGNISWDRYKSLIDIAKTIVYNNLEIEFNVYTGENRSWILNNILNVDGLNYKGSINYEQVKEVMENSDILLHVEDFGEKQREGVRYSFSTKIADSLSSNRCLFAYGPKDVASMQYLINNECAFVATNKEELLEKLQIVISNEKLRIDMADKAIIMANKNHNVIENQNKLLKIINNDIGKN